MKQIVEENPWFQGRISEQLLKVYMQFIVHKIEHGKWEDNRGFSYEDIKFNENLNMIDTSDSQVAFDIDMPVNLQNKMVLKSSSLKPRELSTAGKLQPWEEVQTPPRAS